MLRHRNFALFMAARLMAAVAVQMLNVAVGWQVYALTGRPFDLGLIGLSQFGPFVVLVLVAGHAADHFDRRRIIILCHAVETICAGTLFALNVAGTSSTSRLLWPILAAMGCLGSARAFRMPTSQAVLVNLVPAERFASAVALSASGFHVAVVAGPTVGGLLYLLGPKVVYGTAVALFLLAAVLMGFTRVTERRRGGDVLAVPDESDVSDVRDAPHALHALHATERGGKDDSSDRRGETTKPFWEGLRFVFSRPVVLGAISLDLFAVLFGGATALLPAYARDILHVGPHGLGLLRTAPGVGAGLTAILLAFRPMSHRVGRWMFGGVAVFGLATIVFGLSERFWISLLALFVLGASDMVSVYIRHLLVQIETPDAIRGRVSAVNGVFIGASNELGEFESGVTAGWLGLVPAVVLGGVATLAVVATWMALFPVLRRMNEFPRIAGKVGGT
ncbi:MAG: MFS transporter [Deltaproteobacteria bacterium]|nr:MFS transporter [Deltaproteobacteria bacterium]